MVKIYRAAGWIKFLPCKTGYLFRYGNVAGFTRNIQCDKTPGLMKLPDILKQNHAYKVLRAVMGIIFVTHGLARLYHGSVPDFGGYLNTQGFLIGVPLAWLITIGEIICGSLLAIGLKARYCVIFHGVVIITGIILIHIPNGWFVVGHGSGGTEYSLLILAALLFIYSREHRE